MNIALSRRAAVGGLAAAALLAASWAGAPVWAADPGILSQPWAKWDYDKEKPVRGGYLRVASTLYIGKMNPNHWPVNDWIAINYMHEKLMITDGSYSPTVMWLAQSIKFESPTTAAMKLREGIRFHDGSAFNADAVKYQMDWIRDKNSGAWDTAWLAPLDTVQVVDDDTLRWNFKSPWAGFEGIIANVPGYALSAHALRADAAATDTHPEATGPYILEDSSPDNYLKVKRNPDWWFAKASGHPDMPYFDGIVVNVIPDPAVQLANLRSGKIDVLTLDKSQYTLVKDDPNLNVGVTPQNWVAALRFNTTKGPFKDIRLRKAVSLAIDRQGLIAGTQFGLARLASCMYPEDHWAHNPELKPVPFDPQQAKRLLAEAGYPNGLTVKGYVTNTPMGQTVAEAIKAMVAKVGIDWQVDLLAPAAVASRLRAADYDMAQGGWAWIYDPDLMATGLYHPDGGFNYGRSRNDEAIALIVAGRQELDHKKRQKIYWKLEKALYENYEDAWLWWEMAVTAYGKNVRGVDWEGFGKHKEAWFWSHPLWFKDGHP